MRITSAGAWDTGRTGAAVAWLTPGPFPEFWQSPGRKALDFPPSSSVDFSLSKKANGLSQVVVCGPPDPCAAFRELL